MCQIGSNIIQKKIIKQHHSELIETQDIIAVEKDLDIYVNSEPYHHLTYMPGQEIELGLGILFSNKVITNISQIKQIRFDKVIGRLDIYLNESIQELEEKYPCFQQVSLSQMGDARTLFLSKGETFKKTGCVHSCLILSSSFKELGFGEDVGRHNAFDKAIGGLVKKDQLEKGYIGIVSSRISYEIIQKAIVLGIGILAGVSAPTSMAIDMADKQFITLIGFFREHRMNIYTHPSRIIKK